MTNASWSARQRTRDSASSILTFVKQPPLGRRTEEGYAIYKEDELGINPQDGGGKHLVILLPLLTVDSTVHIQIPHYVLSIAIVVSVGLLELEMIANKYVGF